MEFVDDFEPNERRTRYKYNEWFCGRIVRLTQGSDFEKSPTIAVNSILNYAKRHDIAAVAIPERDRSIPGEPHRFVRVWGDASRSWADGPTDDIREMLARKNIKLRR
ncbi:MAG: hypothetical protein ACPHCI_08975 [Solirubrobacterales bacterium]